MESTGESPHLHIDNDWKAQAQAEKARLAQQSRSRDTPTSGDAARTPGGSASGGAGLSGDASGGGGGELPPATFETLLSTFITQALFAMGAIPDPQTGQPVLHLDLARHQIDMLGVLEAKTKGNLTDEENQLLASALYELRSRYVQVANAARGRE